MSKTNTMENSMLVLYFHNVDHANVGDAAGLQNSATAGSFYVSLHTADPGEAPATGQLTSEIGYTSYARQAVARSSAGWTISANNCSNATTVSWPASTGATATATYFGIGTSSSGTGVLLYKGALTANLICSNGVTPQAAAGALDVTED